MVIDTPKIEISRKEPGFERIRTRFKNPEILKTFLQVSLKLQLIHSKIRPKSSQPGLGGGGRVLQICYIVEYCIFMNIPNLQNSLIFENSPGRSILHLQHKHVTPALTVEYLISELVVALWDLLSIPRMYAKLHYCEVTVLYLQEYSQFAKYH